MVTERTLEVDLDQRVLNSPRFKAKSVQEYFQNSRLDWWKPKELPYLLQEEIIENWLKNKKFQRGLEIGPGFGRITKHLYPRVENLKLVEVNKKAIKSLEKQFSQAKIIRSAVENYSSWRNNYELIVAVEVLVHIPNVRRLVREVSESLEEGGIFIASITPDNKYGNKRTIIHRGINQKEFEGVLAEYKFVPKEKKVVGHLLTYCLIKKK